jgi:hypothetical protein
MVFSLSVVAAFLVSAVAAGSSQGQSEIIWDGRIPRTFPLSSFDDYALSPFNAGWNHGKSVSRLRIQRSQDADVPE